MSRRAGFGISIFVVACVSAFLAFRQGTDTPGGGDVVTQLEFETRYRSGLDLAGRMQLDRALAEFDACLRIRPADVLARFHRGRVLVALGRHAEARSDLDVALARAPNDSRIRRYLLDLHTSVEAFRDNATARAHYLALKENAGGLVDLDLQVHQAIYQQGVMEPYRMVGDRLRGRRDQLDAQLRQLYDAFFPGGNEDRGVQGIPGFATFNVIFDRCPGLTMLRQTLALELANPSRLGLPDPDDDTVPGSKVPLGLADQILEDLIDYSVIQSAEFLDLFSLLAMLQMKMGDYADAATRFRALLKRSASNEAVAEQSLFQLALCLYKLDDSEKAAELFRELARSRAYGLFSSWLLHLLGKAKLPLRTATLPSAVSAGLRFQEDAMARGVGKIDGGGTSCWGDYDQDGDLDLYVSGCDTFSALYRNDGGTFTDDSVRAGLDKVSSGFTNVFVDYDGDGDLDLFVARDGWAGPMKNSLLENDGGIFTDVTEASGLLGPGSSDQPGSSFTASWSDFDRDGDLDLFVANGICGDGSTSRLWRNDGGGRFSDATTASGLLEVRTRTIGCAVGDYDLDGWPDIFLSGFEPTPNRLYHNRGDGTFEEVAKRAGVDDEANVAMGFVAFIDDLNGDALPDIFMTKWEGDFARVLQASMRGYRPRREFLRTAPRFFVNQGNGTFRDASETAGFLYPHGTMGAGLADLDNDGSLDIYLGNGGPALERLEPDSFYVNLGRGRFVEAGGLLGLNHPGKGHGVSFADFDRDGDLDVYVPLGGAFHGDQWRNAFYLNLAGNSNHWLQVSLEGTKSHRMAIGARVKVRAGDLTIAREKKCGVGFGSGDSPYLHFGLGRNTAVASMTIFWPSGTTESFQNVPIDRFLRVVEGRGAFEVES